MAAQAVAVASPFSLLIFGMGSIAARVVKKDPSHSRAVVLRFSEDGKRFWLPVEQVSKWLQVRKRLFPDLPDLHAKLYSCRCY